MDILNKILDIVADVTQISSEKIISRSRKEEVSLARKLFVNVCLKYGFSTKQIATAIKRSNEGIRGIFVASLDENRQLYRSYYKEIIKKLTELEIVHSEK